jgi:undecaprenyl diphosphate synthase
VRNLNDIHVASSAEDLITDDARTITDRRLDHDNVRAQVGSILVPEHVGLIMDGNGRWATRRGEERIVGHAAGEAAILATMDAALARGVRWVTLYAFSTENWNRPPGEVDFLMEFNRRLIETHGLAYYKRGVRFRYMGSRNLPVPSGVAEAMTRIENATADASSLTVTFAFNYGGRQEIINACRRLVDAGSRAEEIDVERFAAARQYPDMPDPDVILRTAGEHRLSNFLLWEAAYAELVFIDLPWPDFREQDFDEMLRVYGERTRTFGTISTSRSSVAS